MMMCRCCSLFFYAYCICACMSTFFFAILYFLLVAVVVLVAVVMLIPSPRSLFIDVTDTEPYIDLAHYSPLCDVCEVDAKKLPPGACRNCARAQMMRLMGAP